VSAHPRQGKRALQGSTIIIALLALATGIFLLDDIIARLRSSYELVAVLPEAPRLAAGSRVWVGGNDVGEVRSVSLLPSRGDSSTRVALALRLPGRVREQVRRDSRVRITAVNLLSTPVLDISPGSARASRLSPGDTLRGARAADRTAVLARAAALRASVDSALAGLSALRAPAARRLAALEQVTRQLADARLGYQQLRRDLEANPLLNGVRSGELSASLGRSRARLTEVLASLGEVQRRAQASGLSGNAAGMVARAEALQRSLSALQATMHEQGGTMERLARDSALVRALAGARAQLDSLLADTRRNPLRYVF